ncbi:CHASE domain-containing protein [Pannonibacter sp. SL95]|uniref:CHASE domain-containing protein n=1 Tax=Pannonibacter sp. SL95 TaxID=2995153 RepID=UPI002274825F|nr:CHASE domain-containing protein [Pannonibacter sp. SL95]MCY1706923.1 CHASE domain-containing protein [Pannonibacter sp. SL95]
MKRYMPVIVFVITSVIGLLMTFVVFQAERAAEQGRFEVLAHEAKGRIQARVDQRKALLTATLSYFEANKGPLSRAEFQIFVQGLDLSEEGRGMQGLGFARLVRTGDEARASAELLKNYGITQDVWPDTDQEWRAPIVMLEPQDPRNARALGFDMFSEEKRRAAMRSAYDTGQLRASAPVALVQENGVDPQTGFLFYIPYRTKGETEGFVYAPFRVGNLHRMALDFPTPLPVLVESWDITDGGRLPLFRSEGYEQVAGRLQEPVTRQVEVGGRIWSISVVERTPVNGGMSHWRSFILGTVSLLFAAALAVSIRNQMRAVEARREVVWISQKAIEEKDLLLQEMKHRIKNSIARILAMARQTAASAKTLDAFSASFSARLQAMANAQDLLTRSRWQKAALGELLTQELEQVFGSGLPGATLDGPAVILDEKATHALGLVTHELATNALKYAGIGDGGGTLTVAWRIEAEGARRMLCLDWREEGNAPVAASERKGFGTRLIDATVRAELGGMIERTFSPNGLAVRLRFAIT